MSAYIARMKQAVRSAKLYGLEIPDLLNAYLTLRRAGLSRDGRRHVLAAAGGELDPVQIQRSLKNLYPDGETSARGRAYRRTRASANRAEVGESESDTDGTDSEKEDEGDGEIQMTVAEGGGVDEETRKAELYLAKHAEVFMNYKSARPSARALRQARGYKPRFDRAKKFGFWGENGWDNKFGGRKRHGNTGGYNRDGDRFGGSLEAEGEAPRFEKKKSRSLGELKQKFGRRRCGQLGHWEKECENQASASVADSTLVSDCESSASPSAAYGLMVEGRKDENATWLSFVAGKFRTQSSISDSNEGYALVSAANFGSHASLDSGCTHSCAGINWIEAYLDEYEKVSGRRPKFTTENKRISFKFGSGEYETSKSIYRIPVTLLPGKEGTLNLSAIKGNQQPLLSRAAHAMGLVLDMEGGTAYSKRLGEFVRLTERRTAPWTL